MKHLLPVWILLVASSCRRNAEAAGGLSHVEVARVTSPDSIVDAVATVGSADATTASVHRVYIVPRGAPVPSGGDLEAFRADYVTGLGLAWTRARMLEIRYDTARIFHFANSWNSREVDDFRYEVEVRLMPRNPTSLPVRPMPQQ
ncbi:hypothetical protein [Longimicrobium sp.]|uniref:hypothetical protein n=1 Tax=Longimicrobium sp. TaxID=2029185 RepID=UPI002F957010